MTADVYGLLDLSELTSLAIDVIEAWVTTDVA